MTITYIDGDIFTTKMPAIGHGVNLQGDMGSGIAKTVREKFPLVNEIYVDACKNKVLEPGDCLPIRAHADSESLWILNLVSQIYGGANAKYTYLAESVRKAFAWTQAHDYTGLALPRIGAGVGGLQWEFVLEILKEISEDYPNIELEIWTYQP